MLNLDEAKKIISLQEFLATMETHDIDYLDQSSSAPDSSYLKILVGADIDKYCFEYYLMEDSFYAKYLYDYSLYNLTAQFLGDETVSMHNSHNTYHISSAENTLVGVFYKNVFLFANSYKDYKEEFESIFNNLIH